LWWWTEDGAGFSFQFEIWVLCWFFYTGTSAEMKAIAGTILYVCWISFLSFSPCIISLLWGFFFCSVFSVFGLIFLVHSPLKNPLVLGFLLHFIEKLAPQPVLPLQDCYSNHERDHGQETWSTICCRFPVESASSAQTWETMNNASKTVPLCPWAWLLFNLVPKQFKLNNWDPNQKQLISNCALGLNLIESLSYNAIYTTVLDVWTIQFGPWTLIF
jgi:hypothetical protein